MNKQHKFSEGYLKYRSSLVDTATLIWKDLRKKFDTNQFEEISDEGKIRDISEMNPDFCREYPIVLKYMVCMKKFSKKAFIRFLDKMERHPKQVGPNRKQTAEEWWIERRADYVRYLYEETERIRNTKQLQNIWCVARDTIKSDFDTFRKRYETIEKDHEEIKQKNKSELLMELLNRIESGEQKLEEDDIELLIADLEKVRAENNKIKVLKQIKEKVILIPPAENCVAQGVFQGRYERDIGTGMLRLYSD
jgi:hypothetical protein